MAKRSSLPTWNLKDLFNGPNDPKIKSSLVKCRGQALRFSKIYRGKLRTKLKKPVDLLRAIRTYEAILQQASKPVIYGSLYFAENSADSKRGALYQGLRSSYNDCYRELIFFELELLSLESALCRWLKKSELAEYRHYLSRLLESKRHRLSELEERLLSDKTLTGAGAWTRYFDFETSTRSHELKIGRKIEKLSSTKLLELLYHPDRKMRQGAAAAMSIGLKHDSARMAFVFNNLSHDKAINDRYRKYPTPEAARHFENDTTQAVVDAMTSVVSESYSVVQEFYRFKAKKMGLGQLYDYDRYAPLGGGTREISYPEAQKLVLDAFGGFSKELKGIVSQFFDKNWIDAVDRPGKRGGAFCQFCTPDLHPYVFINWAPNLKQVSTLAHELGHGAHAYLMRQKSYLNFDVPLTVAETASVFSELLLFEHLKRVIGNKRELFPLYVSKIEGIFATVFRQVSMYRFEQAFHRERAASGELSVDQISQLWLVEQQQMFGRSVKFAPGYELWWSYIPHFIHTPFYVYAYAFGELLTVALFARSKKLGKAFVPKYLELLAAGGTKSPAELFRPLGIDLTKKSFWQEGIAVIRAMVQECMALG